MVTGQGFIYRAFRKFKLYILNNKKWRISLDRFVCLSKYNSTTFYIVFKLGNEGELFPVVHSYHVNIQSSITLLDKQEYIFEVCMLTLRTI